MPEIIGIDHIYLAVSDLARSERFYDVVMKTLGFRKNEFQLDGERHIQYYNRHFGYVLRPARVGRPHDSYAPGLHHLCFRVEGEEEVKEATEGTQGPGDCGERGDALPGVRAGLCRVLPLRPGWSSPGDHQLPAGAAAAS